MEQYLNSKMEKNSVRFEVLNFGLQGYNSANSLVNFVLNVIDFSPDYVVFHHAWNDKMTSDREHFRSANFRSDYTHVLKSFSPPSPVDKLLIRMSVIYRELRYAASPYEGWTYFAAAIHRERPEEALPPTRFQNPDNLQAYWRNVRTIIDVAKARGIVPVMTTQPHSTDPRIPRGGEAWFIDAANATMRNGVRNGEQGVILVDLDKEMTGTKNDLFVDLGHLKREGIRLKARMIGDAIYRHYLQSKH
jgi:hypothetical protein